MAFDQATRNRLARFVSDARALLTEEFTRQLQLEYGLDPASGARVELDRLAQLDDARRATAVVLRETLDHYLAAASGKGAKATQEALDRIVREQAFTVLNRLCALRMAEARSIIIESVAQGYQSRGFQLYGRLAGTALGETGDAYRAFLFSLFDELAVDLPVLFERFAPEGRLFPRESALLELLALLNHPELAELWAADETVGWVYQYFNSKDERQAMRAASQAPRNSRELAVRNQFFTPRYVVEFLADNTLGRTWYEMTQGQTGLVDSCRYLVRRPNEVFLSPGEQAPTQAVSEADAQRLPAEGLSQEELLQQPVYIPHRPLKDPRAILMLDPACGSMHFGLYAFDLFERIYEEAWELETERGPMALDRAPLDAPLHEAYPDKEAFLRDVPRLIVERNIHGVDIDPRAVQIAGLALWLRAQRSWREQGVKAQDRPKIERSNIVCAEPMPGDPALLDEFVARELSTTPEDKVVAQMLRRVFKAMELAGEAGSLLKIEEEIRSIIAEGKKQAAQGPRYNQTNLFGDTPRPHQGTLDIDASGITDESFWQRAEGRIYAALEAYAGFAESSDRFYRRRLFADDARQGFAFIDLCRKLYDVVLMNPPYGEPTKALKAYLITNYPSSHKDLYAALYERSLSCLKLSGIVGALTSRTFLQNNSFALLRELILFPQSTFITVADLGLGVLDGALVETAAAVVSKSKLQRESLFIRMQGGEHNQSHLLNACNWLNLTNLYLVNQTEFAQVKESPVTYWLPQTLRKLLQTPDASIGAVASIRQGLATGDDFRFIRAWWEVKTCDIGRKRYWAWLSKGGEYSPWFYSIHLLVNWKEEGKAIRNFTDAHGKERSRYRGYDQYFKAGLTYPFRTVKGFNVRALPEDCIFTIQGPSIVAPKGILIQLLSYLNSGLCRAFLQSLTSTGAWQVGYVQTVPFLELPLHITEEVNSKVLMNISLLQSVDRLSEISPYFVVPELFTSGIKHNKDVLQRRMYDFAKIIEENESFINHKYSNAIGIPADKIDKLLEISSQIVSDEDTDEQIAANDQSSPSMAAIDVFLGYSLGTVLGRWDIRYATGKRPAPDLPDPFAPLPVCPPGMLQNAQGLPAAPEDVPVGYPLRISWPGILVDDEGHAEDIVGRAREAIRVIWGARADAIEQEACEILGVRGLREYFARPASFFADHLSRYSKSRRQAPIYWPLSTPSGSYTLWLYYHRLSDQTLYSCVNDFVEPKLKVVSDQLSVIGQKAGRTAKEEKELEQLSGLRKELIGLREELLRAAAFWKPNLNDGVQITAAPLWRLFQHKPWQKRLKETWDKLEQGEYDWAHLAYSIWPERVREKCKGDRSLAIAHDLEVLYVAPPASVGKGRGRAKKAIQGVVEEPVDED